MTRYTNLPVGTRIYYTGDMANQPGAGIITRCFSDEWYASQYDIKLDDGRKMRSIHPSNFGEAGTLGGFRFELQSERDAFRNAYMFRGRL